MYQVSDVIASGEILRSILAMEGIDPDAPLPVSAVVADIAKILTGELSCPIVDPQNGDLLYPVQPGLFWSEESREFVTREYYHDSQ